MTNGAFDDYRGAAGDAAVERLFSAARDLRGTRVVHVSSSGRGGGVAELLKRQVPLMRAAGIDAAWQVLRADAAFLAVTKDIHRALQGDSRVLSRDEWARFEEGALAWASDRRFDADMTVIHDPQPLPLVLLRGGVAGRWLWRCHIDLASPAHAVWTPLLQHYVARFDATIVSTAQSAAALPFPAVVSAPSIDPLSDKNCDLSASEVAQVIGHYHLAGRPYLLQIARFDAFKDPVGVVRAFRTVREQLDCALVLASGSAEDDSEQLAILNEVRAEAKGIPDVHTLFLEPDFDRHINALQRGAALVVQKSLREGFGLPVAEAMWKGKCVIGGRTSGIALQITDGVSGYLVDSPAEAAERMVQLLRDPRKADEIGSVARESVRARFLIVRELTDFCRTMNALWQSGNRPWGATEVR
jgi:trehalose synthase